MNIDKFRSLIVSNYGLQYNTRYVVEMEVPRIVFFGDTDSTADTEVGNVGDVNMTSINEMLQLFCVAATSPAATFNYAEVKRYGHGLTSSYPIDVKYSDINLTFLVDAGGTMQDVFHRWIGAMMETRKFSSETYLFQYKKKYTTDLRIRLLSQKGEKNFTYIMEDAYPVAIGETSLMWDQSDVLKLPVMFKFTNYRTVKTKQYVDTSLINAPLFELEEKPGN